MQSPALIAAQSATRCTRIFPQLLPSPVVDPVLLQPLALPASPSPKSCSRSLYGAGVRQILPAPCPNRDPPLPTIAVSCTGEAAPSPRGFLGGNDLQHQYGHTLINIDRLHPSFLWMGEGASRYCTISEITSATAGHYHCCLMEDRDGCSGEALGG